MIEAIELVEPVVDDGIEVDDPEAVRSEPESRMTRTTG